MTSFPGVQSLGVDLILDDQRECVLDVDPFGASLPGFVSTLPNGGSESISVRGQVLRSLSAGS